MIPTTVYLNNFAAAELDRLAKTAESNREQVAASVIETWALYRRRQREEAEARQKIDRSRR